MAVDLREIQPGWDVYEADGNRVGDVVAVDPTAVHVKTGGIFSKDLYLPPSAIAEVEQHRVELNVSKSELNRQGWDKAPV